MAINKQNVSVYLPFIQALAQGHKVETLSPTTCNWYVPKGGFVFDQDASKYRIVPQSTAHADVADESDTWKVILLDTSTGDFKIAKRDFDSKDDADAFTKFKAKYKKVVTAKVIKPD